MANVPINKLADEIVSAVREYTGDVTAGIDKEVESTADKVLMEVQNTAPRKTGKYAKSFVKTDKSLPGKRRFVIWNRKYYRLVHLLEFGHTKIKGGRVDGKPHLIPAHQKYVDGMVSNIKQIIKNGG